MHLQPGIQIAEVKRRQSRQDKYAHSPSSISQLLKQTGADWLEDKAPRLGAALAYYTVFSLPPLLVMIVSIAGIFLGPDAARGELHRQFADLLGAPAAEAIQGMLITAQQPGHGLLATLLGLGILLFGASGVFGELQGALNTVWEVEPKAGQGVWVTIQNRFLSFAMVLGTGFLLLVSLVLSAAVAAAGEWLGGMLLGMEVGLHVLNFVLSLGVITVLFALIFKLLPDVQVAWRDVWIGAAATALLFTVGKLCLGLYLGHASIGTAYGAAASVIIILVWVYYSAQILLLGAEFTQAFARMYGSHRQLYLRRPVL